MSEVDKILLDLLDQHTYDVYDYNEPTHYTKNNAEVIAVMYLEKKGIVKRTEGIFPETKFIEFIIL